MAADVAATFHIEPNHNPRAGEAAQAWFALTRKGGAPIPLSECDCRLAVYPKVTPSPTQPILQPTLQAINAEQYRGIPGAKIVFPAAGEYELRLTGSAKSGANFQPFTFRDPVLVRPGQVAATPVASESAPAITIRSSAGACWGVCWLSWVGWHRLVCGFTQTVMLCIE
jgi:hypothetical protein